ncbi:MAG: cell division protein FtsZ, partial [Synergistaceae bacterium]|nr:cell division protein FtsZ [Synergistaceae bacterium]
MADIFEIEKASRPFREVIKVMGIGGGGNNALNHIARSGLVGVEF